MESLGYDESTANIYSAIIAVGSIYFIILSYSALYFYEDFAAVFCPKVKVVPMEKKAD